MVRAKLTSTLRSGIGTNHSTFFTFLRVIRAQF